MRNEAVPQDEDTRAMRDAFREATLSLLGVFHLYELDPDVEEATASALGAVFRKHLRKSAWAGAGIKESLTGLLSELDASAARKKES